MTKVKFKKASSGLWSMTARNPQRFIYFHLIFIYYGRPLCNDIPLATWPSTVNKSSSATRKSLSAENKDWLCNCHQSQRTLACLGSAWLLQTDCVKLKIENYVLKRVSGLYGVNLLPCYASLWLHSLKALRGLIINPLFKFSPLSYFHHLTNPWSKTLHFSCVNKELKDSIFAATEVVNSQVAVQESEWVQPG